MNRKVVAIAILAIAVVLGNLVLFQRVLADPPPSPLQQSSAQNTADIDVTVNDQGDVSVAGIYLSALGMQKLDPGTRALIQQLQNAHVNVANQEVNVDVQGTQLAKLLWNAANRANLAALLGRYGVALSADVMGRVEEWIGSSDIDVTASFSNQPSKPANLALTKLLLVDLGPEGQVSVEKAPLNATLDAQTLDTLKKAGNQMVLCWNKGTLHPTVDGGELPSLTVNPEGLQVINKSMNLGIGDYSQSLLGSRFGVDVALPGAQHSTTATCPE